MAIERPAETLKEFLSTATLHLFIPGRVFKLGHITAALYIVASIFGATALSFLLQGKLYAFIELMAQKYQYEPAVTSRLQIFVTVVSWFLVSPLFVSGTALPSRLIFVHGRLPPFLLLKETPMAIRLALQSTVLALRISAYYLAAPLALLLAHQVFLGQSHSMGTVATSYFLLAVVSVWAFVKLIPIILVPFTAVVGFYEPWGAVGAARQITSGSEGIPGILLAFTVAAALSVRGGMALVTPSPHPWIVAGLEAVILGYLLLCVSGLVVRRVALLVQGSAS